MTIQSFIRLRWTARRCRITVSLMLKSKESERLEAVSESQAKITVYRDYLACLSLLEPAAATEKMLNSCAGYSEQAKKLQVITVESTRL